jgi:hypothetical protein
VSTTDEYELTEEDARRLNELPQRSHSGVKAGEKFPAITSRVDDVEEYDVGERREVKVAELHHLHVFLPDHVEAFHVRRDVKTAPKKTTGGQS